MAEDGVSTYGEDDGSRQSSGFWCMISYYDSCLPALAAPEFTSGEDTIGISQNNAGDGTGRSMSWMTRVTVVAGRRLLPLSQVEGPQIRVCIEDMNIQNDFL